MLAQKVYYYLNNAIEFVVKNKEKYVKNPTSDFTRTRKLSLDDTIRQILSMEGGSLQKELYHFTQISRVGLTPSAFVQQRSKILSSAFETIFKQFNELCIDRQKYKGYKILAVDGSDINHFRNPDSESFITFPGFEHGYNQTHLNAIYDVLNKTYVDVFLQPRPKANEQRAFIEMLKRNSFKGKNIITADRGYESYNVIANCINTPNIDFLLRVRNRGAMREIEKLPLMELDKYVTIEITTSQTNEDKRHGRRYIQTQKKKKEYSSKTNVRAWDFESPYTLQFRVVRFMLDTGEYETIVTSLPKSKFSIADIKELYHMRWGIETSFRDLKYAIGLINLHCKKEDLVAQEIYAALIMYNYCSRMAANVSVQQSKEATYAYRVNFTMAIHLCKLYYKWHRTNFRQLLLEISKYSEPIRPGRSDKRNVKHKRFVGFSYRVAA